MAVQECDALVQLATVLNRTDEATRLQARADAMRSSMAQLWDDEAHIYTNLFANGTFYRRISPTSFYSMMAKVSGWGVYCCDFRLLPVASCCSQCLLVAVRCSIHT